MTRRKKKVLIAENKQFLVDVIRESLRSEGYDCVCVNTENELYGVIDNVDAAVKKDVINPKRKLREARKQSQVSGIGTKSQQALKLHQEENKLERKVLSKEMKEAEKQRQFDLKQEKRKKKHRGH